MLQELVELHDALEERHWWFVARRRIVLDVLRRQLGPQQRPLRCLDIGCGAGGMLAELTKLGEAVGVDPTPFMVERAAARTGMRVLHGWLPDHVPVERGAWDVVTLLDVLEHIDDDAASLRTIAEILRPGGVCVITVPALMLLWSRHDEANGHRRRYHRRELLGRLTAAGFEVQRISYFNTLLFPPIAAVRLLGRLRSRGSAIDLKPHVGPFNGMLTAIFAAERHVLRTGSFPFGVSLIAVVRTPARDHGGGSRDA